MGWWARRDRRRAMGMGQCKWVQGTGHRGTGTGHPVSRAGDTVGAGGSGVTSTAEPSSRGSTHRCQRRRGSDAGATRSAAAAHPEPRAAAGGGSGPDAGSLVHGGGQPGALSTLGDGGAWHQRHAPLGACPLCFCHQRVFPGAWAQHERQEPDLCGGPPWPAPREEDHPPPQRRLCGTGAWGGGRMRRAWGALGIWGAWRAQGGHDGHWGHGGNGGC